MEAKTWTGLCDRSSWGPGPWDDEPDKVEWRDEATGLPCLAVRNGHMGVWCGYVGVPPGHPLHGCGYSEETPVLAAHRERLCRMPPTPDCVFDVHGGLTYSAACSGKICHEPAPGESDDVWWFGFDCGHYRDLIPGRQAFLRERQPDLLDPESVYRDLAFVRAECASLARQLAEVKP